MHVAKLADVALHWREDGDPGGVPLVFANSLGTDLRLWDNLLPLLPAGFRIIRFDKRGHGLSSCPGDVYSMMDLTNDTAALLDRLQLRQAIFVGLSIGGMIGQTLAATRPDLIRALVLSNTAAKMGEGAMWQDRIRTIDAGGIAAMVEPILDRWFADPFRSSDDCEAWRNMLLRTPKAGYLGCCHAIAGTDLSASTAKLSLPLLAIAGSEDGASPPDLVRATAGLVKGARFEVIDGAGHLPCVEKPAEYAAVLNPFLTEHAHV